MLQLNLPGLRKTGVGLECGVDSYGRCTLKPPTLVVKERPLYKSQGFSNKGLPHTGL